MASSTFKWPAFRGNLARVCEIVTYELHQPSCSRSTHHAHVHSDNMPECQAYGCLNKPDNCKGKSFFKIPDPNKNPSVKEQAKQWLHFIGTGHSVDKFNFGRAKVVCEDHFTADQFTEDAHIKSCRLLNRTPRYTKVLIPGAVPTVFVHRPTKKDFGREARQQKRVHKKQKQVSDIIGLGLSHCVSCVNCQIAFGRCRSISLQNNVR